MDRELGGAAAVDDIELVEWRRGARRREVRDYVGMADKTRFFQDVAAVYGGTVSPGGATAILRVSRQAVYGLVESGYVRAWVFREYEGKPQASIMEISVKDLILYGIRVGRISGPEDIKLHFPGKEKLVADCKMKVLSSLIG